MINFAGVAQLVERNLAKVDVTGSNPASRSKFQSLSSSIAASLMGGLRYVDRRFILK